MNYNNETSCPTSYLVAFRCAKHYCSCQLQHLLSVRSTYKRIASEPAVRVQSPVNSVLVQRDKVRLGQWFLRVSPDSPCQTWFHRRNELAHWLRHYTCRKVAGSRPHEANDLYQFTHLLEPHYALRFTQPLIEMSAWYRMKQCFRGELRGRHVRLTTKPSSVSRMSRQCGILNISQPYRSPRPVRGVALFFFLSWFHQCSKGHDHRSRRCEIALTDRRLSNRGHDYFPA
jgi:hypothetical protein